MTTSSFGLLFSNSHLNAEALTASAPTKVFNSIESFGGIVSIPIVLSIKKEVKNENRSIGFCNRMLNLDTCQRHEPNGFYGFIGPDGSPRSIRCLAYPEELVSSPNHPRL